MTTAHGLVISACILLLCFMAWKEVARANRHRLAWRLLASALSVAALAFLILPIGFKTSQINNRFKEAILLTEGFSSDSLYLFLKGKGKDLPVFTTDKNLLVAGHASKVQLTDSDFFEENKRQYHVVHVFGYGLDDAALKSLNHQQLIFHRSPVPAGIQSISWTNKIRAGQELLVQGTYYNTSQRAAKLIINGLHTNLDSVMVQPGKKQEFELKAIPKHIDRAVYSLTVLSGKDTVESEELPVEVLDVQPLKLLILASSPDFENKFLKNWLAAHAYKVLIRTNISKEKYQTEFLNMPAISVDALTPATLEEFDVVVSDADELTSINKRSLDVMQSLVERGRLGLIIKADSIAARNLFYSRPFPLYYSTANSQESVSLQWANMPDKKPVLNSENFVFIRNIPGTQALISDQESRVVVSSTLYGTGKIVFTTLNNTFTWLLSGNDDWYYSLWSFIIDKAIKGSPSGTKWSVSPAVTRPDEPVEISLQTTREGVPFSKVQGNDVFLEQSFRLPFMWTGRFWPSQAGWQSISQQDGKLYWWYVFGSEAWKSLRASKKIEQTMKYASDHHYEELKTKESEPLVTKQVPKFYFFCMFILCCSFLWIEKKICCLLIKMYEI